jgi:hypothetical protein
MLASTEVVLNILRDRRKMSSHIDRLSVLRIVGGRTYPGSRRQVV